MGETIELTTSDGHKLGGYRAEPTGEAKGGVVIVQEIFGVNGHIRHVCDSYAEAGYVAVAPALFDRIEPGLELEYDEAGTARGRKLRLEIAWDDAVKDIEAAMASLSRHGKVGVVGYCYGGSVAWLSATRLRPAASVCYYGGQILEFKDEPPNCPVQMHFGSTDPMILPEHVEAIKEAQADAQVEVFLYDAGHGFTCDERSGFHAESTALAKSRTLAFLDRFMT
ncbi:dienelactone hydrolase family protein [Denitrobaculum tricleocarpae]|uniref:Dienelactone hydrolase family protein n=1 Tax=Denitrobaculum tricleocarpae TaxID=2591009 RepID=A0A545TUE6_9PROT|nr:dienelactone hydrolase family protein [Denitrobaculum tricleocarpae]TQV80832.1 dienelactone hydrolase family protein [Denitrobaculum tricleocarpae]